MKKYLAGFLIGVIVTVGMTAFADEINSWIAERATFDVYVGGEKFESNKPVAVIDGSTYLPLKATGEALGVSVEWNVEDRRVEVGEVKTPTIEVTPTVIPTSTIPPITLLTPKPVSTPTTKEQFGSHLNTKTYYFKSDLFETDNKGKHALIMYKNEQYTPLYLLGSVLQGENDNWSINIRGEKTPETYAHMGTIYVKLSSVGLKARIEGDTAYLEWAD